MCSVTVRRQGDEQVNRRELAYIAASTTQEDMGHIDFVESAGERTFGRSEPADTPQARTVDPFELETSKGR